MIRRKRRNPKDKNLISEIFIEKIHDNNGRFVNYLIYYLNNNFHSENLHEDLDWILTRSEN